MAISGTITNYNIWNPCLDRPGSLHPNFTFNQTVVAFTLLRPTTSSHADIIAKPSVARDTFVTSLLISYVGATAACGMDIMMGTETIGTIKPFGGQTQGMMSINFGLPGLCGGTTSTMTISLKATTSTITSGLCVATCFRKK